MRTLEDATVLQAALRPGIEVVVAGSGFVGCEVAATARMLGCHVTVVGEQTLPMLRPLGSALAGNLMRRHEQHGVNFRIGRRVVDIVGDRRVRAVALDDGTRLDCDVLVEAIGSVPNIEWLRGNDLDLTKAVHTDGAMRALKSNGEAWPGVFAVGDVARFPNAAYGRMAHAVEHWNIPTETAKRAGGVLAAWLTGSPDFADLLSRPFAPIPSFWTDQYDAHLLAYGMLDLADHVELLHGDVDADCIVGYFRDERLVGVCGIGMPAQLQSYRAALATNSSAAIV